ncbi:hypothetical protein EPI10_000897 [Gossypium australe]|uniref:Uncharacterized protein n=1 Tax=Gossypium australe TaxID=47621 RepID=A0A5B6V9W2_9ROSI|nr:hypothetical protein EPI10_000897 [Gossypium australe]
MFRCRDLKVYDSSPIPCQVIFGTSGSWEADFSSQDLGLSSTAAWLIDTCDKCIRSVDNCLSTGGYMRGGGSDIVPTGTSVLVTHCDYGHQRFGTSRGLVPQSDLSLWLTPPWVGPT